MNTTRSIRLGGALMGLCLTVLLTLPVAAQRPIAAGVRAGVSLSSLYGDDVDNANMRAHFNGGVFATYRFGELFAVQPEVLFSEKGGNVSGAMLAASGDATYTFGYLEIPLLAKVYVPTAAALRPSVFAGPALDVKLYGDVDNENLKGQLKNTDFGIVGGVGLDYRLGGFHVRQRSLSLDARYTYGLTDVLDVPGSPNVRNSALTFSLGFGF